MDTACLPHLMLGFNVVGLIELTLADALVRQAYPCALKMTVLALLCRDLCRDLVCGWMSNLFGVDGRVIRLRQTISRRQDVAGRTS